MECCIGHAARVARLFSRGGISVTARLHKILAANSGSPSRLDVLLSEFARATPKLQLNMIM